MTSESNNDSGKDLRINCCCLKELESFLNVYSFALTASKLINENAS